MNERTKPAMLKVIHLWLKFLAWELECMLQCKQEESFKSQDCIPWDESKHPRKPNGEFGEGSTLKNSGDDSTIRVELANCGEAIIHKEKLTMYALNPDKAPDKAKAFELALGYTLDNVDDLLENVRANISKYEPIPKEDKGYGERYQVVLDLIGPNGKQAPVLTAWIKDKKSKKIRLTSIYVKRRKKERRR